MVLYHSTPHNPTKYTMTDSLTKRRSTENFAEEVDKTKVTYTTKIPMNMPRY
jgi:hypothetical protein